MDDYRHEIDGMRALAVISVIFFHAGFSAFPGGYVGVDVFFVISGYLITSIILVNHLKGTFSLLQFYERRARRILPALFVVLLSCLPFAYHYMLSDQLENFVQEVISVTLCSSNILLWTKEDYFNSNTEHNPLVHTWSLAIEEQFYIFFSLLFVFFSHVQHRSIILLLIPTSVISLILAQWSGNLQMTPPFIIKNALWFSQHDWASFYLLTGRMWELLLGAFAGFYLHHRQLEPGLRNEIGAVGGLSLILLAIFRFGKDTPFPSFYTLVPTMGALMIILYGDKNTYVGRMLSMKMITMIGLCSYSVYLWHQPLLAFAKLSEMQSSLSLQMRTALIFLSLILGYLSWRFIETPFRGKTRFTRGQIFAYSVSAGSMINLIAVVLLRISSSSYRLSAENFALSEKNFTHEQHPLNNDYLLDVPRPFASRYINQRFRTYLIPPRYNKTSKLKRLAIIGDSHAKDFVNIMAENNKLTNYQIRTHFIVHPCPLYIGAEDKSKFIAPKHRAQCDKNEFSAAIPLIKESDVIILVACWQRWSAEHINSTIRALNLRINQTIIVVGAKVFSTANPKLHMDQPYSDRLKLRSSIDPFSVDTNKALIEQISPNSFVDIQKMVCGVNNSCPLFTPDERLVTFDGSHTTKSGAKYIGNIIFNKPPLSDL